MYSHPNFWGKVALLQRWLFVRAQHAAPLRELGVFATEQVRSIKQIGLKGLA
jgi:hypothetical protein